MRLLQAYSWCLSWFRAMSLWKQQVCVSLWVSETSTAHKESLTREFEFLCLTYVMQELQSQTGGSWLLWFWALNVPQSCWSVGQASGKTSVKVHRLQWVCCMNVVTVSSQHAAAAWWGEVLSIQTLPVTTSRPLSEPFTYPSNSVDIWHHRLQNGALLPTCTHTEVITCSDASVLLLTS